MDKVFISLFLLLLIAPIAADANGGDQRVLGNEYLVNLARSPFTPIAGTKISMVVSFVDLKTGTLIQDDLLVAVRIGEGRGSKTFIHEEKDILVKGGILEWSYIFDDPGIHELFFNFAFVSDPQKIYEPPDFLLDVQEAEVPARASGFLWLVLLFGVAVGFVIGWFSRKKVSAS